MADELVPDEGDPLYDLPLVGWEGLSRRERDAAWSWFCAAVEDGEISHPRDNPPGGTWAFDLAEGIWRDTSVPPSAEPEQKTRRLPFLDQVLLRRAQIQAERHASGTHDVAPQSKYGVDEFPVGPGQVSLLAGNALRPVATPEVTENSIRRLQKGIKTLWRLHAARGVSPPAALGPERAKCFYDGDSGDFWPIPTGAQNCFTGRWTSLMCQAGHRQVHWTGCCTRKCAHCAGWVGRRRARRAWQKTHGGVKSRLGVLVFTIPPELRHHLKKPAMLKEWWRRVWGVVEEWGARVWGQVRLGGSGWFHPCGSVNVCSVCHRRQRRGGEGESYVPADKGAVCCNRPMTTEDDSRWHPHFNVMFPLICMESGRNLRWHKTKQDLHALREAWQAALSELTGEAARLPVADYGWRGDDDEHRDYVKKSHSLRYFARAFPTWSDWTSHTRWFGAANPRHWKNTKQRLVELGVWRTPPMGMCSHPGCGLKLFLVAIGDAKSWDGFHAHPLRGAGGQVSTCGPPPSPLLN